MNIRLHRIQALPHSIEKPVVASLPIANRKTTVDCITFTGQQSFKPRIDYKAIDPLLSEKELTTYQQVEQQWHTLIQSVPNHHFERLKQKVERTLNTPVSFKKLNGSFHGETTLSLTATLLLTAKYLFGNEQESRFSQLLSQDLVINLQQILRQNPPLAYAVLAHEAVHVLQLQAQCAQLQRSDPQQAFMQLSEIIAQPNFKENALHDKLYSLMLKPDELRNLKRNSLCEYMAYTLETDLHTAEKEKSKALQYANGYREIIQLVNHILKKSFNLNSPARFGRSGFRGFA